MGRVSEVSPFMPISNTKTVSTSTAAVSPVLPRRNTTSISGYLMGVASQQQTPPPYTPSLPFPCSQPRVKDSEGRLPPSPSDPCQSADLRRAALMRSLQMRSQSPIKPVTTTPAIASQTDSEKAASAQVLEGGAQLPEQTGCNSEVLERSGSSLFPSVTTRASTRVRSLLQDEPNVVDTVEMLGTVNFAATSSTTQEQEIIKKGTQEARFESVTAQQQKGVRGCSKLGNVAASDGNTSDSESKQPSRRPSAATAKKSSKRAKRLWWWMSKKSSITRRCQFWTSVNWPRLQWCWKLFTPSWWHFFCITWSLWESESESDPDPVTPNPKSLHFTSQLWGRLLTTFSNTI